MKTRKLLFTAKVVKWFDKANGNTYHSVQITRNKDNKKIFCKMTYGYDEHYKQTGLEAMFDFGWINKNDYHNVKNSPFPKDKKALYEYERTENYPIYWAVTNGTKKECLQNGNEY